MTSFLKRKIILIGVITYNYRELFVVEMLTLLDFVIYFCSDCQKFLLPFFGGRGLLILIFPDYTIERKKKIKKK